MSPNNYQKRAEKQNKKARAMCLQREAELLAMLSLFVQALLLGAG